MRKFIKDFFLFPFKKDNNNKINRLLDTFFKDFPAFFWEAPSFKKILILPLLFIYHIFSK